MKERPILFSAPMVNAILEHRKTQTRRIVKPQPLGEPFSTHEWACNLANASGIQWKNQPTEQDIKNKGEMLQGRLFPFKKDNGSRYGILCPYGKPGDRFWVRESFHVCKGAQRWADGTILYRADHGIKIGGSYVDCAKWKPSIHMPRKVSRIMLEITGVRIERLQDMSEEDAKAEGIRYEHGYDYGGCNYRSGINPCTGYNKAKSAFEELWKHINGDVSWKENPWVWVVEFKPLTPMHQERSVNET